MELAHLSMTIYYQSRCIETYTTLIFRNHSTNNNVEHASTNIQRNPSTFHQISPHISPSHTPCTSQHTRLMYTKIPSPQLIEHYPRHTTIYIRNLCKAVRPSISPSKRPRCLWTHITIPSATCVPAKQSL